MRSSILALIATLISTASIAATFEARSEHYSLTVENTAVSAKVVVTDLDSSSRLISEEILFAPGRPSSIIERKVGDLTIYLTVNRGPEVMGATLQVEHGETQIDWIRSNWILAPRPRPPVGGNISRVFPVGGDVHAPQVVHRVEPIYPADARANKISGLVIVRTVIDATGKVADAKALSGPPELVQSAVDAVKQWTFEPGTKDRKPVPVMFNLTVNFKLN